VCLRPLGSAHLTYVSLHLNENTVYNTSGSLHSILQSGSRTAEIVTKFYNMNETSANIILGTFHKLYSTIIMGNQNSCIKILKTNYPLPVRWAIDQYARAQTTLRTSYVELVAIK
jgi:hypothetical protein